MRGIKTFGQVLRKVGKQSAEVTALLDYTGTDKEILSNQAFQKLKLVAEVLNDGWKPDWNNTNQWKYYPWFKTNKSGSGLSCDGYDYADAGACVGSRLCFDTWQKAEFAGKTFEKEYNTFLGY